MILFVKISGLFLNPIWFERGMEVGRRREREREGRWERQRDLFR